MWLPMSLKRRQWQMCALVRELPRTCTQLWRRPFSELCLRLCLHRCRHRRARSHPHLLVWSRLLGALLRPALGGLLERPRGLSSFWFKLRGCLQGDGLQLGKECFLCWLARAPGAATRRGAEFWAAFGVGVSLLSVSCVAANESAII